MPEITLCDRLTNHSYWINFCAFVINYIADQILFMKRNVLCLLLISISVNGFTQQPVGEKPKLVVGIVVDQMRQEYLYRYATKFGEGGFKRMMGEGFMMMNAHYNYAPTFTGPGHASVYTGATPAIHGIVGNDFYDRNNHRMFNCVEDNRFTPVGVREGNGDISPMRMLTTTITDELKLSSQKKSKVVGVSIKDRGAVLPAGHMANAAYWFDSKSGRFISSTYYMSALPEWVEKFNKLGLPDKYLSQTWNTFFPIDQYSESGPDDSPYERKMIGKERPTFPYNLKELRKKNTGYDLLISTPFANDYLTEMAKAILDGENLGKSTWTDFLAVSYSSPDIIGHAMGPNAVEVEDTYIRLDRNIEDLLKKLDNAVGAGNYTVFLTADHAVAEVSQYLRDSKIPAGYFNEANLETRLKEALEKHFPGKQIIENISNYQVYINQEVFKGDPRSSGIDLLIATELISNYLMAEDGVANVYTENSLRQATYTEGGIRGMVMRGYNPKRSGDIVYVLESGWMEWDRVQGSTHGSPYTYDTHVPMLFYGFGIKKGRSVRYHPVTDIAPTLSVLLKLKFPSGCTGQPIEELFNE
jgi:predicted AlkP superfamily pyrophosphatase or phosphodiesterase